MERFRFGVLVCLGFLLASPVLADQVFFDDVIVRGSDGGLCTGLGCQDGEVFGFDGIRLKGDVLRIHFEDTSVSAAFPTNDWRIVINDDDSGSVNRFSIEDTDAGTTPFTVEAGAPTGSFFLASHGGIGIGTIFPQAGVALDVRGNLQVDEVTELTGSVLGAAGVKAGILDPTEFVKGVASVTFQEAYVGDYIVQLTPVSSKANKTFRPTVLSREATGFTISAGKKNVKRLVEMHWMTQPVGE